MTRDAQYWIRELGLRAHPEGGYYRQTYKSQGTVAADDGIRAASTSIQFLLEGREFSGFHRIASDEVWHAYDAGSCAEPRVDGSGSFQAVVPGGCWFASRLEDPLGFALVGCTVAPGFEFADFELAKRGPSEARRK